MALIAAAEPATVVGDGVTPAAALFRSLADPTRLRIVQRLTTDEARVTDLSRELGLAQSTVSKHMACLRDCGLVDYRVVGRQSFYAVTCPQLLDLLRAAEGVLAATGSAVALCPTYGDPTYSDPTYRDTTYGDPSYGGRGTP